MAKKEKMLTIKLVKSTNNSLKVQKATVEALGLRKIGQSVTQKDNAQMRGMCFRVKHLIKVEEV